MSRCHPVHRCTSCGTESPKWSGRCPGCGAWNSMVEAAPVASRARGTTAALGAAPVALPIGQVDPADGRPQATGLGELDRVLSGGLVPGSVTLLGGEPGIGKSTLLLQVLAAWPGTALYVTAEESAQQVRVRAERLGPLPTGVFVLADTSLPRICHAVDQLAPSVVVIDSVQAVADPDTASGPGSVVQVRECTQQFVAAAKASGCATVLVGHVTKDGALAGPRVLEHMVDTVLSFEGDRHHSLRLLRAVKHRFGTTSEVGLFDMTGTGLQPVPDAGRFFLTDRTCGVPGSVVVPITEGRRTFLVEVQALVTPSPLPAPRRSAQGLDQGRLSLLLAVLARRAGLGFGTCDVYASVVGGLRLTEPGGDLGVCLAAASALLSQPVDPGLVVCGEVGLAGEVRQAAQTPRRLAEAARLGFTSAIAPRSARTAVQGLDVTWVRTLGEALAAAGLDQRATAAGDAGPGQRALVPA